MDQGQRVLLWAQQNLYSLASIAATIGYDEQTLSAALHSNRISPELAEALLLHYGLRVLVTNHGSDPDDTSDDPEPPGCSNGVNKLLSIGNR